MLIRRPVEDVFDFVADERTEPIFNHNMLSSEKVTDGPIGVGTRFRAIIRAGRKALPMDIEYTGFDRPHLIVSSTHMSTADFSGTLTFTPTPSGTRLRWSWQTRPRGVVRLASPALTRVGARQESQMWTQLRDHLEAASHARNDAGPRYVLGTSGASTSRATRQTAHRARRPRALSPDHLLVPRRRAESQPQAERTAGTEAPSGLLICYAWSSTERRPQPWRQGHRVLVVLSFRGTR